MIIGIGIVIVFVCVLGGYAMMGGSILVLWQPFEYVIICGAAAGAYVISNPTSVLSKTMPALKEVLAGSPYTKERYIELISLLYSIFKLARTKGMLALESHIENPHDSELFKRFPGVLHDHHALEFLCDYLRILTMGTDNANQLEDLMNEELDTHHEERNQMAGAIQSIADGMPALGIVAAVLGVIKTMGYISQPPEILGKMIGGALVGTFAGVFISYGFVAPLAGAMKLLYEAEAKYYQCMKAGILAHLNGCAPAISAEFSRKALLSNTRPTFTEIDEVVSNLPSVG